MTTSQKVDEETVDLSTEEVQHRALNTGRRLFEVYRRHFDDVRIKRRQVRKSDGDDASTTSSAAAFPKRIFVQDLQSEDSDVWRIRNVLKSRGEDQCVIVLSSEVDDDVGLRRELAKYEPFRRDDMFVAIPAWIHIIFEVLGIPKPDPPDYPTCLRSYLGGRRIWRSSLGRLKNCSDLDMSQLFIKPASHDKLFNGLIPTGVWLDILIEMYGPDVDVYCSELVDIVSEYAVYVVDAGVRAICHYACKQSSCMCKGMRGDDDGVDLDLSIVNRAVRAMAQCEDADIRLLRGYRADFAVIRTRSGETEDSTSSPYATCLVEVNDGYVAGAYPGVADKDFVDMQVARFEALQSTSTRISSRAPVP